MSSVRFHHHRFTFPENQPPAWSKVVDRWYQLDAYAYGLAEASYQWRRNAAPPELVFLASEKASNDSDRRFAESGAQSPAKFVHTLPNVRVASLCLVLDWKGPVLCLQKDPQTVVYALQEASTFPGTAWVTGVRALSDQQFEAYLFEVTPDTRPGESFPLVERDAQLWDRLRERTLAEEWYRYE